MQNTVTNIALPSIWSLPSLYTCIVLYWISDGGAIWCAFWEHVPLLTYWLLHDIWSLALSDVYIVFLSGQFTFLLILHLSLGHDSTFIMDLWVAWYIVKKRVPDGFPTLILRSAFAALSLLLLGGTFPATRAYTINTADRNPQKWQLQLIGPLTIC